MDNEPHLPQDNTLDKDKIIMMIKDDPYCLDSVSKDFLHSIARLLEVTYSQRDDYDIIEDLQKKVCGQAMTYGRIILCGYQV
jgi:hypothetical protein